MTNTHEPSPQNSRSEALIAARTLALLTLAYAVAVGAAGPQHGAAVLYLGLGVALVWALYYRIEFWYGFAAAAGMLVIWAIILGTLWHFIPLG